MVNDKLCRVCGYEMEEGPRDYNICPSCGTEFGLHDLNSNIEDLRKVWLDGGAKWYSTIVSKPEGWKPMQQLAKLIFGQIRIPVYSQNYSVGISVTQLATAESGAAQMMYACKQYE
jgi:hypothetical protein